MKFSIESKTGNNFFGLIFAPLFLMYQIFSITGIRLMNIRSDKQLRNSIFNSIPVPEHYFAGLLYSEFNYANLITRIF